MSSPAGNPAGVRSPHWSTGAKAVLLVGSTELELFRTKGYFFRQVVRDLVGLVIGEDDIWRAVSIPIARCKAARPDSGDGQWIASVLLIDCGLPLIPRHDQEEETRRLLYARMLQAQYSAPNPWHRRPLI